MGLFTQTAPSQPTFLSPWGMSFRQPRLSDHGIYADEWCYVHGWSDRDEVVAKQIDRVFSAPRLLGHDAVFGRAYLFPATLANLEIFISLPFISQQQRGEAAELLLRWSHVLPYICLQALGLRALTEPRGPEYPLHRKVVTRTFETIKRRREPTPAERTLWALTGKLPNLEVEETVVKSVPFDDAELFQQYSNRLLYSQQLIGAWAICLVKRLGLFYDMRTGKTDTAIVAMLHAIKALRDATFGIVVAPKNNLYDPWVPNLERFGFDVHVLDGTEEEDREAVWSMRQPERPTVLVLNYERVASRYNMISEFLRLEDAFLVMDETAAIKNPTASRSKAAHLLSERTAYCVLLNGSPMEQGPQDLWSQLRCLDPAGVVTGASFLDWVSEYLQEVAPGKYRVRQDEPTRRAFEMMLATLSIRYIRSEADQSAGQDKNFRYIKIKPTAQMAKQARNIHNGFVDTVSSDGEKKYQTISECVLAIYGALRELSCGYDKYREDEDSKYIRVRHTVDPKLLWIRCFIEANPTMPLVVACNFNEQEQALKEMLDEMGITWSSTRPAARKVINYRLPKLVPQTVWSWMEQRFGTDMIKGGWVTSGMFQGIPLVEVPMFLRYHPEVVEGVRQRFYYGQGWTETYTTYVESDYRSEEKAAQRVAFNAGETHVYICKVKEMRGFSLNRIEAVSNNIGTYPTIIYTSPPWSLGDWDQSQDRCVGIDPRTNKSICTMIYALVTPGIEDAIMGALRSKKEVQAELLKDAERQGYSSFVENLVKDMEAAVLEGSGDGVFDTEEMLNRITLGIPPVAKLTERNVLTKMMEKYGPKGKKTHDWRNRADVLRFLQQDREAVVFSEDGVILNPDAQIREAYFGLLPHFEQQQKEIA